MIEGVGLWRRSVMRPSGSLGDLFDSLAQALIQPEALPELTSDGKDARQIAALLRRSPTSVDLLIPQALAHAADLLRKDEDRQLEKLIESYRNLGQTEDAARCEEIRRSLKARAARLVLAGRSTGRNIPHCRNFAMRRPPPAVLLPPSARWRTAAMFLSSRLCAVIFSEAAPNTPN